MKGSLAFIVSLLVLSPLIPAARGADRNPRIAEAPAGTLFLWGGGTVPDSLTRTFDKAATHRSAIALAGEDAPQIPSLNWKRLPADATDLAAQLASAEAAWLDIAASASHANLVDQVLIDPGFLQSPPAPELLQRLNSQPGLVGIGIPKGSALLIRGRRLQTWGASPVIVCLPASVTRAQLRPLLLEKLHSGEEADLIALSRAAIARLGPVFPPEREIRPEVTSGTLLTCGGGDLPDALWQRFIDLAGGVDAPIVLLPIAQPDPDATAPKGLDRLKALGCKHLTVLNQHTRADVESPAFATALKQARGVWFVGGRQWKYVDAYQGTVAEDLFRDVLARGGVIGGTSAGAAIQAQYLVRGDPLSNKDIIAEGYEQGLDFLPGVAIDIHVSQRGRLNDLLGLIHTFPQLLGIAIDEDTAAEIHGHTLKVLGDGRVTIINEQASTRPSLQAGDVYDLAERETVNAK